MGGEEKEEKEEKEERKRLGQENVCHTYYQAQGRARLGGGTHPASRQKVPFTPQFAFSTMDLEMNQM